MAYSS